jgi:hypothetical protein
VKKGENVIAELRYDLDLSDGLRVMTAEALEWRENEFRKMFKITFGGYEKSNGVWFPKEIGKEHYDGNGNVDSRVGIRVLSVEVNPEFTPDAFNYHPTYGSAVRDETTGFSYRAGYLDPTAPLGHDVDPTKALQATSAGASTTRESSSRDPGTPRAGTPQAGPAHGTPVGQGATVSFVVPPAPARPLRWPWLIAAVLVLAVAFIWIAARRHRVPVSRV